MSKAPAIRTEPAEPRYNAEAVDAAIRASRQKIGGREARLIHALLKGPSRPSA